VRRADAHVCPVDGDVILGTACVSDDDAPLGTLAELHVEAVRAQRRGGREEQPLRRFGLGRSMVVR